MAEDLSQSLSAQTPRGDDAHCDVAFLSLARQRPS